MIWSLVVLCLAAAGVVASVGSLLSALVVRFGTSMLSSRSPAARARILRGLVLFPFVLTLAVMAAALAPSFGWVADHCNSAHEVHAHPHICAHHETVLPAWPVALLASFFGIRFVVVVVRVTRGAVFMRKTRLALQNTAKLGTLEGVSILPLDRPQAFVLGIFAPQIFLTRGLLTEHHRRHLDAVLAHERAHVSRRDSGWRLAAQVAHAFHLPIVARRLDRALARAHEMAADDDAARSIGSRSRVAEALVHVAQNSTQQRGAGLPRCAPAFAGSDIEQRVVALLDARRGAREPTAATLLAFVVLALTTIALAAEGIHHGLEVVMGLFTG